MTFLNSAYSVNTKAYYSIKITTETIVTGPKPGEMIMGNMNYLTILVLQIHYSRKYILLNHVEIYSTLETIQRIKVYRSRSYWRQRWEVLFHLLKYGLFHFNAVVEKCRKYSNHEQPNTIQNVRWTLMFGESLVSRQTRKRSVTVGCACMSMRSIQLSILQRQTRPCYLDRRRELIPYNTSKYTRRLLHSGWFSVRLWERLAHINTFYVQSNGPFEGPPLTQVTQSLWWFSIE